MSLVTVLDHTVHLHLCCYKGIPHRLGDMEADLVCSYKGLEVQGQGAVSSEKLSHGKRE